ncbi:gasdermin-E-like isoform X2 [Salvelinus namaycush]|uniref:Gasdermin-E-like isoform X2 n=1 Tax=Salvelinus namaycush TaxID=8040 RepID=A0A8U0PWS8_SALNM|nr:gasdermin-E-like isoform X2 [Salvelinus namaycush]
MFASATENFVKNVDSDGNLIPVSSLNNCGKLNPLSLVLKQSPFFWKTKYTPTKFTLDDVLTKNPPLNPAVKESDFVGYGGTFGDSQDASVDVETKLAAYAVDLNFNMGAKHASTLKSSLGKLKKEEVDVKWLQNISKDKLLDMSLSLIQDARNNSSVFGVVMERIVTSEPCSIREKKHQAGNVGAGGNVTGVPVSVKGKVEVHGVKDVFLEIPKNTVIAYSIEEIKVKRDGHFEVCSFGNGGFEPAWQLFRSIRMSAVVSLQEESILHQELEKLSGHFQVLSSLPTAKRSSLLQLLKTTMEDREAVSVLESVLDQMLVGETPDMDDLMEETEKQIVQAILELLHKSDGTNEGQTDDESPSLLCSTNLIEGQTDNESPSLLCSTNLIEGQTDNESPSLLCSTNLIEGQTDDESPSLLCSTNLIEGQTDNESPSLLCSTNLIEGQTDDESPSLLCSTNLIEGQTDDESPSLLCSTNLIEGQTDDESPSLLCSTNLIEGQTDDESPSLLCSTNLIEGQTDNKSPSLLCSTNLIEGQTDDESPSLLCSINLIVSAMNEMTDEGLSVLGSCCSPPVLQALQILVHHVAAGSGETLSLRDAGLAVLTEEEVFGRTESLFGHSEVTLKREEDTLRTEMKDQPGYLPLVMSITVKGLASLV